MPGFSAARPSPPARGGGFSPACHARRTACHDASVTTLAFLGGTGDQGRGLARRFAMAGHTILIGSRSAERAEKAAAELRGSIGSIGPPGGPPVSGAPHAPPPPGRHRG